MIGLWYIETWLYPDLVELKHKAQIQFW